MKNAFRQSMGWLHTWAGLIVGWLLFFLFLTGTLGYFDTEIDRWMQPERPLFEAAVPSSEILAMAIDKLKVAAPGADRWVVRPPFGRESNDLIVSWRGASGEAGKNGTTSFYPSTGEEVNYRKTGGGQLLYRMHYRLHYLPAVAAYWIVGICTMIMFVAIVTGVIVHRRIFKDFFTLRWGGRQRSWLDAHNVLAVLVLPFHVMITYSGLMFFAYLYMAPVMQATYGVGEQNRTVYFDELFGRAPTVERVGRLAELASFDAIVADAEHRAQGEVLYVEVHQPGDANARIYIIAGGRGASRYFTRLLYNGVSGELLQSYKPPSAVKTFYDIVLALHEGLFAGTFLRWLYFITGLLGTAMIGAGLVLWTVKRRDKIGDTFGFNLVERLNIATVAGLPAAIVVFFLANRLIPAAMEGRAAWEAHTMFIAWAILLLHALVRPARRAWIEQIWIAAAICLLLPVVNALTTDRHLGVTLPAGDWILAGFDLTILAFGIVFAATAWKLTARRIFKEARA
jgi:uncharacterized iron-regulated membrane protein